MAAKKSSQKMVYPSRIEGWLNVWEVDHQFLENLFQDGRTPRTIWEPHFCILLQDTQKFTHFRTEKAAEEKPPLDNQQALRLDGGKKEFDKRWGYETLESIKENAIQHFPFGSLDVFSRSATLDGRTSSPQGSWKLDFAYDKSLGERRGSVPVVSCSALSGDSMDSPSTPSKLASFFSKKTFKSNLKRTKSVTKLDRKRTTASDVEGDRNVGSSLKRSMSMGRLTRRWSRKNGTPDKSPIIPQGALIHSRMRTSRSHESLLTCPSSMHSIDLSGPDIEIKPLHSSILGQDHCFQVSTSNGSKYYSCRTAEEREKWIECLRKTVHPNQEQTRRTDNSLKLWIVEAKNLSSKKRYFCEICLDKTLYARTSSKTKTEMLFWGEQFDFNNLPAVEQIMVNIYREADKKKKKEKNVLLGYVNIPVTDVNSRQLVERWYTASSATVGKAGRENKSDLPLIRIKARYQTVHILPMDLYQDLVNYVSRDYCLLVEILEPLISVKAKEEIASSLVHIFQKLNRGKDFLSDIVMQEVDKLDNENLTFRGNSIATKAMEAYMKLVGEKYLRDSLGDFVKTVLESTDDCEVDPKRVPSNSALQRHQTNLVMFCEMAWFKIINSCCFFPVELREVFASFAERCQEKKREDVTDHLVSACIFLRFLCPAILSPSLFSLTQEYPQERGARNLTLIAKTIQNLANFTKFGGKEDFMTFMNDFVEREWASMKSYLQKITEYSEGDCQAAEFDGYIDLGKELSLLHSLLVESLEKMNEASELKLGRLKSILEDISDALENPQAGNQRQALNNIQVVNNMLQVHHSTGHLEMMSPPSSALPGTLHSLMKDYSDADLSRANDFAILCNTSRHPRSREPARDLNTSDDYVMFTALESTESTAAAPVVESRAPATGSVPRRTIQTWSGRNLSAAQVVNGDYVDLISFMDEIHEEVQNSSVDLDDGSQLSIGQLSTVASSGYQSFGYSQSSSPVDSAAQHELSNREQNRSPGGAAQPLSFSNPLFRHQAQGAPAKSVQTEAKLPHVDSSSSLSSTEGANTAKHDTSSPSHQSEKSSSVRGLDHPLRTLSNGSYSSDSEESLPSQERYRVKQSPRRRRKAYSQSATTLKSSSESKNDSSGGQPFNENNLASCELSKSAEFAQLKRRTPLKMKRTSTDTALMQGCSSERGQYASPYSNWRASMPQNTVRMGIRSVQRKLQDHEKSKSEYEAEIAVLRQQLTEAQTSMEEAQKQLDSQGDSTQSLVAEWQQKLEDSEKQMQQQQQEKDEQMKGIIQRLINVEEELRREQAELHEVVSQKQLVIESQERRIQSLEGANARLLAALNQLKDRYQLHNRNGVSSPTKAKLTLAEEGEYRASSC